MGFFCFTVQANIYFLKCEKREEVKMTLRVSSLKDGKDGKLLTRIIKDMGGFRRDKIRSLVSDILSLRCLKSVGMASGQL